MQYSFQSRVWLPKSVLLKESATFSKKNMVNNGSIENLFRSILRLDRLDMNLTPQKKKQNLFIQKFEKIHSRN